MASKKLDKEYAAKAKKYWDAQHALNDARRQVREAEKKFAAAVVDVDEFLLQHPRTRRR